MLDDALTFLRYARRLRRFLAQPLQPDQGVALVQRMLREREQNFLRLIQHAVYGQPNSPYQKLLRWAGVEYGDIERLVRSEGIEATLERLLDIGVYVSLDEFKGKRAVQRAQLHLDTKQETFDNPLGTKEFRLSTSGSSARARRVAANLDHIIVEGAHRMLVWRSIDRPIPHRAVWRSVPPGASGIKEALAYAKYGRPLTRWFSQTPVCWGPTFIPSSLFLHYTVWASAGLIPRPTYTPLEEARRVADWLAHNAAEGAYISLPVTAAVAVAEEARQRGYDYRGVVFRTGGEPLTPLKAALIESTGATLRYQWSMSEVGPIAACCAHRTDVDEMHLFSSAFAIVARPRPLYDDWNSARAIYLTTLSPTAPKLMLNVEIGDSAVVHQRACGCPLDQLGFTLHLHQIRSYEKLTTVGMHITGEQILQLVERVLPQVHGGSMLDYQLAEDHGGTRTRLYVIVDPRAPIVEPERIPETVLKFLSREGRSGWMMAEHFRQARVIQVLRRPPFVTPTGKKPPLVNWERFAETAWERGRS